MASQESLLQKRNGFSQILAAILVNAVYEMKNYPIVLSSTRSLSSLIPSRDCIRKPRQPDRGSRGRGD